MALIRWEPQREMASLQHEVNRLFGSFFDNYGESSGAPGAQRWLPPMDLIETPQDYVLRADLPGMSQEDVSIELEGGVLTISGERRAEHEDKAEGYYRMERASGKFARTLTLPEGVDGDAIQARFEKGVLEVRVRKPVQRKPQRIAIDGGEPQTIEQPSVEPATATV